MPEYPPADIALTIKGIDQIAVIALSDCIDGEIAPCQILLQRHAAFSVKNKAFVAWKTGKSLPTAR